MEEQPRPPIEHDTATYAALLEHPDTHPGLVPHLERLSGEQAPISHEYVETPEQRRQRQFDTVIHELEEEFAQLRETTDDLAPPYAPSARAVNWLEAGDFDAPQLSVFIHKVQRVIDTRNAINSKRNPWHSESNMQLLYTLFKAPGHKVREVYESDSPASRHLKEALLEDNGSAEVIASFLKKTYDIPYTIDLLQLTRGDQVDEVVIDLFKRPAMQPFLLSELLHDTENAWEGVRSFQEENTLKRDWGERFLSEYVGIPDNLRKEIQLAGYARTMMRDDEGLPTTRINSSAYMDFLEGIASSFKELGPGAFAQLHEQTGITNFDYYTTPQLMSMSNFINGGSPRINYLKAGDVTVVFLDAKGDYNGAFRHAPKLYESNNGRTLYFEINKPSDFYRHWTLIKKHGIKPATFVMGAHGREGAMGFGDSDFDLVNTHPEDLESGSQIPLVSAKGLKRIAKDYMQDSRGIDDNEQAKGRRRLVLMSCSQAKPAKVRREQKGWRRFIPGLGPVETEESMARTFFEKMDSDRLDMYASPGPTATLSTPQGIELERTEVRMENGKHIVTQSSVPITHIRRRAGVIVEETVQELALYADERQGEL